MKLHLPKKLLQSTSPSLQARAVRIGKGGCNELTCQPVNLLTRQPAFYRRHWKTCAKGYPHRRRRQNLHPWVRVDQAIEPLPPKTLSILVGLA